MGLAAQGARTALKSARAGLPLLGQAAFLAAFSVLFFFSVTAFLRYAELEQRIRYRIPENTIWAASQVEVELNRTLALLNPAAAREAGELARQFDILWSRAALYKTGVLAAAIEADEKLAARIASLRADLALADPHVAAAAGGEAEAMASVRELLAPHRETVRMLTTASLQADRAEREALLAAHAAQEVRLGRLGLATAFLLFLLIASLVASERRTRRHLDIANAARGDLEQARNKLGRQADHLEKLADKARRASRAKSEFLAMMSHDIRTPLNAVIGLNELLAQTSLDARQRSYVGTMSRASESLLALINDILDLTRLEAGKVELQPAAFSPAALLDDVASMTRILADARGNAVETEIGPDVPAYVAGDVDRIRQVLLNFTGNANKFTGNGRIRIAVRRAGGRLRFAVCDTGTGIPDELRARLFKPFEQGRDARKAAPASSGLGLAISDRLVRLMGGAIEVTSAPDAGAEFAFALELPEAAAPPRAAEPVGDAGVGALAGRRILLADDTPANLFVARAMLESLGAEVVAVDGGRAAAETGAAERFDAILLDIQMPDLDGVAAMRRLREALTAAAPPIMALTAQSFARDRERLIAAGFDGHIAKPVRRGALLAALSAAVQPLDRPALSNAAAPPAFDSALVDELRADIGAAAFTAIVAALERETNAILGALSENRLTFDQGRIAKLAHKLAGVLSQCGLTLSADLARRAETAPEGALAPDDLDRLADASRAGLSALRAHLRLAEAPGRAAA